MWLVLHAPVTTDLLKERNPRHLPVPPRKALTTKAHREYELTQPDGAKSNERSGPNRGQIGLAQPRPPCSTVCWGKHDSLSTVDDWERAMDQSRDHSETDTLVVAGPSGDTYAHPGSIACLPDPGEQIWQTGIPSGLPGSAGHATK